MSTSTSPMLFTSPDRAKTLVPVLPSVPTPAWQAAPRRMMEPIPANVSTLFRTVGLPHSPCCAGNGGLGTGMPRRPSMERMRAVSSPQTKAPAPW